MNDMPTKERILYAALDLFAEKGYDGVGVDLIAENAGLKGPSLYRHYNTKRKLVRRHHISNIGTRIIKSRNTHSVSVLVNNDNLFPKTV